MSNHRGTSEVRASYDADGDILYVSLGAPVPADSESRPRGILLRYRSSDDVPCGVTVLSFAENRWDEDGQELAKLIAAHLRKVDASQVLDAIQQSEAGALHG